MQKINNTKLLLKGFYWIMVSLSRAIYLILFLTAIFMFYSGNNILGVCFIVGSLFFLFLKVLARRDTFEKDADLMEDRLLKLRKKLIEPSTEKKEDPGRNYIIKTIRLLSARSGEFIIVFDRNVVAKEKPLLKLNGSPMTLQSFEGRESIYFSREIPNDTDLVFEIGDYTWTIDNPYSLSLETEHVRWQTKGHSAECNIFIDGKAFNNPHKDPIYEFHIKINSEKFGPFSGTYDPEKKYVKIYTGQLKANCENNTCTLMPVWNKEVHVKMPKPELLSVNHKPKQQELFV